MFSKIAFLLSISAVLASHLKVTPEELKEFFKDVDTQVKALEHETIIQIRTNELPLQDAVETARTKFIQNLTISASTYWTVIESLERSSKDLGENATECINSGNDELYALNASLTNTAYEKYNDYSLLGNEILNSSSTAAYTVIEELIALEQVVAVCNDETCATDLKEIVTQYFLRAKNTLDDAETKARNYVLVYLAVLLDQYSFNPGPYVSKWFIIIGEVATCINNLREN